LRPTYTEFLNMDIAEARAWAEHLPLLDDGTGQKIQGLTSTLMAIVGKR
jgi:hypothetical protein